MTQETAKLIVRNPYPEWQSMASDTNCWNCYKLLWLKAQAERHTCDNCHNAGVVAVEEQS